jgi:hypothetical protein
MNVSGYSTVKSNICDNQESTKLPPVTLYCLAREQIERTMNGSDFKETSMDVQKYAEKVVNGILKKKPSDRISAGTYATLFWAVATFGWHTIWVSLQ